MNRKRKVIRNTLMAVALVALGWTLAGFPAWSTRQALRWEGRAYGLSGPVEIVAEGNQFVAFRAGDHVGWANVGQRGLFHYARIEALEERGTVNFFASQGAGAPPQEGLQLVLHTDTVQTGIAQVVLTMTQEMTFGADHYDWDETYTLSAPVDRGAALLTVPLSDAGETGGRFTHAELEEYVMTGFLAALRRGEAWADSRYSVSVTIYDAAGTVAATWAQEL